MVSCCCSCFVVFAVLVSLVVVVTAIKASVWLKIFLVQSKIVVVSRHSKSGLYRIFYSGRIMYSYSAE